MLFTSLEFALFLPAVLLAWRLTPPRRRWAVLLAASYVFYGAWRAEYLLLIAASTLIDWAAALRMARAATPRGRRGWLIVSVATNLAILIGFKYLGFFADTLRVGLGLLGIDGGPSLPAILLPVGISFYTFQTMGYSIDVYRGRIEPERHLGRFALYVAFFPQLVAGPIERAGRLLPQLAEPRPFDWDRAVDGLRLMLWGFVKKLVIADRLAVFVSRVYDTPGEFGGWLVVAATYLFFFQLYCDFSAYTDIARGAARIFGVELMENFRWPLTAVSPADFWRRWHVSLMNWFRDYLYAPLRGRRPTESRRLMALFGVFALAGLWHGAGWNFVLWGALQGGLGVAGQRLSLALSRLRERGLLAPAAGIGIVPRPSEPGLRRLGAVVSVNLVIASGLLFRAHDLEHAWTLLRSTLTPASLADLSRWGSEYELLLGLLGIAALLIVNTVARRRGPGVWRALAGWQRWGLGYAMLFAVLLFGEFGVVPFVYFQF